MRGESLMTKSDALKSVHAMVAADPYAFAAKGAFWLSGVVAVGTLAVAVSMLTPPLNERASRSASTDEPAQRWTPVVTADEPEGEPVRVRNPFDKTEVFEFPAGTTLAEARALMNEMLLERARERYAQIDRRS
jgi:hypothetical protein